MGDHAVPDRNCPDSLTIRRVPVRALKRLAPLFGGYAPNSCIRGRRQPVLNSLQDGSSSDPAPRRRAHTCISAWTPRRVHVGGVFRRSRLDGQRAIS